MLRDELSKQETARRVLLGQLASRRLSHAYLFTGPAGVGKRMMARAFAVAINSDNADNARECLNFGVDPEQQHPDVHVVQADGASIKLQQVRSVISRSTLTPNQGRYRVFIIEEAERLTREAANALLLTLEEPSPTAVFILTASAPLLPTIISRCQVIQFHQSRQDAVAQSEARAGDLALLERIMQTAPVARLRLVEEIDTTSERLDSFLATILSVMRDLLVWAESGRDDLLLDREAAARFRPMFSLTAAQLAERCHLVVDTERMSAAHVNRRLLWEQLLVSL